MLLKSTQIQMCYDLVESQIVNFNLQNKHPKGDVRSVDDFAEFCKEQYTDFDISELRLPFKGQPAYGSMIQDNTGYHIFVLNGLNYCWKRIVLCKELFHIILDMDDKQKIFKNSNWEEQVEKTLFSIPDVENTTEDCAAVEGLAEICAMELLFPYSTREKYIGSSIDEVANSVRLPKILIEEYLSKSMMNSLNPNSLIMPEQKTGT